MGTIFDIQADILKAFNAIEDNDGDVTPEIEEALAINKENLINKVKSYVGVIKTLENDKELIKEEVDRLKALEKSKTKSIDWLKQTLMEAVENFGNIDKKGKKFIDYNTGKVSISTRKVVEVDEEEIEEITNKLINAFTWFNSTGQLNQDLITFEDLLDYVKEDDKSINLQDLSSIDVDINVDISLQDLIEFEDGFELAKALIKYNDFKIKTKADKPYIRELDKLNKEIPYFAKIVDNKSILIK